MYTGTGKGKLLRRLNDATRVGLATISVDIGQYPVLDAEPSRITKYQCIVKQRIVIMPLTVDEDVKTEWELVHYIIGIPSAEYVKK